MTTVRVIGQIDETHRLTAFVPDGVPAGRVEVVVVVPVEPATDSDPHWLEGVAREWHDDLADGKPANEAR